MPAKTKARQNIQTRPFALPAPGSWLGVLADSNGDRTINSVGMGSGVAAIEYGALITALCLRYGWNVINETYTGNGSFETNTNGCDGTFGCTIATSTTAASLFHGAQSLRLTANYSGGSGMYATVGGARAASLSAPTISGGAVNAVPAIADGGRDMIAPGLIVTPVAGGSGAALSVIVTNGAFVAVRVDAGGTGYASGATVAVDAATITDTQGVHGSGATFTATVAGGVITGVAVATPGSGYPDTPKWVAVPSNGVVTTNASGDMYVNAAGAATLARRLIDGTGYTAAPNVYCTHAPPRYKGFLGLPAMQAGEVWTLHGWLSGSGNTGGNVYLQVVGGQSSDGTLHSIAIATGAANPATATKISLSFTVPAGFGYGQIRCGSTGTMVSGTSSVWLDGLQLLRGNASPSTYTDYPTGRGGYAAQTFSTPPGGFNAGTYYFSRLTQHAQANIVLLFHLINDLGFMSAGAGGQRTTIADLTTALDAILPAIAAMANAPKVVIVGLPPWLATTWNASAPTGYRDYYAAADAVEALLQQKATQYGAIYVPARKYLDGNALLAAGQSNQVHLSPRGHQVLADIIALYLEGLLS